MNRRGFVFGLGATLAVARVGLLMPVSTRHLIRPVNFGLDLAEGPDYSIYQWIDDGPINCRCVLKPTIVTNKEIAEMLQVPLRFVDRNREYTTEEQSDLSRFYSHVLV